jgi:maleylacetate reductase
MTMSRREILEKAASVGALTVVAGLTPAAIAAAFDVPPLTPTPANELGPFYKRKAPQSTQLRIVGDSGFPLAVSGRVLDTRGQVLPEASLEVWHSDHRGHYDLEGYRYRARLKPGADGTYAFESILPGHYPGRVAQHVHYLVTAPGHRPLVTQLYFATDPAFLGDPDKNFGRDPLVLSRELVRPVTIGGDPSDMHARVTFELVLETA